MSIISPTPVPETASLIVYGGGGHGKAVIDLVRILQGYHLVGIVDDQLAEGTQVMSVPVLGGATRLVEIRDGGISLAANAVGGIGNIQSRVTVFDHLREAGFDFPILVHPRAFIEPSAHLEAGTQIFPLAYVGSEAHIGFGAIINYGVGIGHDCKVGDYTNISPGTMLAGSVTIGRRVLIGMNVTINIGVTVDAGARIGNGATVKADVPAGMVVHAGQVWPNR